MTPLTHPQATAGVAQPTRPSCADLDETFPNLFNPLISELVSAFCHTRRIGDLAHEQHPGEYLMAARAIHQHLAAGWQQQTGGRGSLTDLLPQNTPTPGPGSSPPASRSAANPPRPAHNPGPRPADLGQAATGRTAEFGAPRDVAGVRKGPKRGVLIGIIAAVLALVTLLIYLTGDRGKDASFAHSPQGARAAAARYASQLGSEAAFNPSTRHHLIAAIAVPLRVAQLQRDLDRPYTPAFYAQLGLGTDGRPPAGEQFVSRTLPAGLTLHHYSSQAATVRVWCAGLLRTPARTTATTSWFTLTVHLAWTGDTWKIVSIPVQSHGPSPAEARTYGLNPLT